MISAEEYEALTPDERRRVLSLVATCRGADAVLDIVPRLTPRWERPVHLRPLADALARTEREAVMACCSVPPRHGKTETISHGLVYLLQRRPHLMHAYVSYSADIAHSKARRIRDLAMAAGVRIRQDQQKVAEWRTEEGGGLISTGIGGPLTGHGISGVLVIDDPVKNREEAESVTICTKVYEWAQSVAFTRLEPGASCIANMTRWSRGDLVGMLLGMEETTWERISLPALDEDGSALWEARWPADELAKRRRLVGDYDWAALYQGEPRLRGTTLFLEPSRYDAPSVRDAVILIACDPATTAKTYADHSVIFVCAGRRKTETLAEMDVLDVRRGQWTAPELVRQLRGVHRAWGAPIAIECVGGFAGVPQTLHDIDPTLHIIPITPVGDKYVRALPVAAAWNDGRVRLPVDKPWVHPLISEVQAFTGVAGGKDDQVDAMSLAWNQLAQMMRMRRPRAA